jgi:hypothetical protein
VARGLPENLLCNYPFAADGEHRVVGNGGPFAQGRINRKNREICDEPSCQGRYTIMKIDPEDSVNISNRFTTVAGLMVGLALLGTAWLLVSAILLVWRVSAVPGAALGLSGKEEDGAPRRPGFGANRAIGLSAPSSGAT